jgi:hypothetical protein
LQELLHQGNCRTVNIEIHTDIFLRLRDAVTVKRSEKCRTNIRFLFHDNAPAHKPGLVKDFLAKNNVTTLGHHSNSPDLVPTDFDLFSQLILVLKGRGFCDATEIIKDVSIDMKRLLQNGFQEYFQQIYSRWQEFLIPQGEYFQRKVA